MKIHRVSPGETVFSIAREYSVPPTKIIENNGLLNPERLSVGKELLILTPTRTYTARGSDTLHSIASRFGVDVSDIIAKNPSLQGGDSIYPGQILTIKSDTPPYSIAFAHGYLYQGCPYEKLISLLPYLTYVSIFAGKVVGDDVKLLFDDRKYVKAIRDAGKIPLLEIYIENGNLPSDNALRDTAILLAKARGYGGITLTVNNVSDYEEYSKFLLDFKRELIEYDLLLFAELDKNSNGKIKECYDGIILSYGKAFMENPPSFNEGEKKIFTDFSDEFESSGAYIELCPFAFSKDEVIGYEEAMKLAYSAKSEISFDENTLLCSFECNKYRSGKREPAKFVFESLENTKAKLELVSELGFMGISIDIMRCPISYLLMFNSMFRCGPCPLY